MVKILAKSDIMIVEEGDDAFQCPMACLWRQVFPKLVAVIIGCQDPACWEAAAQQAALQQCFLEIPAGLKHSFWCTHMRVHGTQPNIGWVPNKD